MHCLPGCAARISCSSQGLRTNEIVPAFLTGSMSLQGINPEDLFPGVEFRISEDEDEDMPYTRPADFQPRQPRTQAQAASKAAARQSAATSRGADAVRALQAQQKAGARTEAAWSGSDNSRLGSSNRGNAARDESARGPVQQEPSVGRGPSSRDLPAAVDAEVGCDT